MVVEVNVGVKESVEGAWAILGARASLPVGRLADFCRLAADMRRPTRHRVGRGVGGSELEGGAEKNVIDVGACSGLSMYLLCAGRNGWTPLDTS